MKKRRTLVISLLLVAALALGIGYAAMSAQILTITGNADLAASNENFVVKFANPVGVDDVVSVSVDANPINASISVTGLDVPNETVTVSIDIVNDGAGGSLYAAEITNIAITQDAENYFQATVVNQASLLNKVLQPDESVTVEISIKLLKAPADPAAVYSGHFIIDFTATPQEATPAP